MEAEAKLAGGFMQKKGSKNSPNFYVQSNWLGEAWKNFWWAVICFMRKV